jgi:hypothetical protein
MRWVEHVARMGQMRNTKLLQQNMKVTLGRHAYMRTWYYKMDLEIGCGLDRSGYWQRAVGMGRHTAQGFLWYVKRAPLQLQLIAYYIFISLISMLILSSHLYACVPNGVFSWGFPASLSPTCCSATCSAHLPLLDSNTVMCVTSARTREEIILNRSWPPEPI